MSHETDLAYDRIDNEYKESDAELQEMNVKFTEDMNKQRFNHASVPLVWSACCVSFQEYMHIHSTCTT